MANLQHAINELYSTEQVSSSATAMHHVDPRAKITVTAVFLVCILSMPSYSLSGLIPFFIFPIIVSARANLSYGVLFRYSLVTLPFVVAVGLFNPIFDRREAIVAGNLSISYGWLSFGSIVIRGLLSVQVAALLIRTTGFYRLCRALEKMGLPAVFTTQLLLVFRYLFVLVSEFASMRDAYRSRSYGEGNASLKLWSRMVGALMLRTISRASRVYDAMISRGFDGHIRSQKGFSWTLSDTAFTCGWSGFLLFLRMAMPIETLTSYLTQ